MVSIATLSLMSLTSTWLALLKYKAKESLSKPTVTAVCLGQPTMPFPSFSPSFLSFFFVSFLSAVNNSCDSPSPSISHSLAFILTSVSC